MSARKIDLTTYRPDWFSKPYEEWPDAAKRFYGKLAEIAMRRELTQLDRRDTAEHAS